MHCITSLTHAPTPAYGTKILRSFQLVVVNDVLYSISDTISKTLKQLQKIAEAREKN